MWKSVLTAVISAIHTTPIDASEDPVEVGLDFVPQYGFGIARISGQMFDDANKNGVRDAGEAGISGMSIVAHEPLPGEAGASSITDADGHFSLQGLRGGEFVVRCNSGNTAFFSRAVTLTTLAA